MVTRLLAAVVALLLAGSATALVTIDDDSDTVATSAATTVGPATTSSAPAGPATTTTAAPSELDALVAELQRFVADRRGLQFTAPLKVTLLDDAAFNARILALAKEDDDELLKTQRELVALGLLERGVDLRKARDELLSGAVIGAYDPKTKQLYVRGQKITPFVRTTLVHEIAHALQDQHFNIEHPEYEERDDEIDLAFGAVAEGDALRVEEAYRNTLSEREQRDEIREQMSFGAAMDVGDVPLVLRQFLLFPYTDGPALVAALVRAGGNARVDEAFRNPPSTSEQVLHPERFLAGEGPKPVATPAADGNAIDQGVVGEYLLKVMLATELGDGAARVAAAGWGGDRYVAWDAGADKTCVRVAWTMDSENDAKELRDAITRWAEGQPDAKVTGANPLVMTSCA